MGCTPNALKEPINGYCRLEAADRLADRKKKKPPKLYPNLRGPELKKLSI